MKPVRTLEDIERAIAQVLAAAPHRAFGLTFVRSSPGEAVLAFEAGDAALGPAGQVHGGALSMLCEPARRSRSCRRRRRTARPATADFHAQFLRPATPRARVELVGRVLKAGGRLAFCEVEARSEGEVWVLSPG